MHETKRIRVPFRLGRLVATPGALHALFEAGETFHPYLKRHWACDWGDLDPEDKEANDRAVKVGNRILSAYHTERGQKLWIITEADRSATTLLLPNEY